MPRRLALGIVVSPGFDATAVSAMLDVAERARAQVEIASNGNEPVTSKQVLSVPTQHIDDLHSPDVVVLAPGSPDAFEDAPFAKHIRYWQRQSRPMLTVGEAQGAVAGADAGPALIPLMSEVLGEDLSGLLDTPDMALSAAPTALQRAIDILQEHRTSALPVPVLAAEVGVSQRQLERLFSAHFGRTPNQYHRRIRLDHARMLLTTTPRPIAEISTACGFASAVHFSRAYKAEFGLSPQQDRVARRRARARS